MLPFLICLIGILIVALGSYWLGIIVILIAFGVDIHLRSLC